MDMKTSPLSLLKDPTLLKTDALINGEWVKGDSRFDVLDPATGRYDAAATPATGTQTLFDFYADVVSGAVAPERGDHAVF